MRPFAGSVVVVTGGAAGIGKAVAQLFVAEGASVAMIDRDPGGAPAGTTPLQAVGSVLTVDGGLAPLRLFDS